MSTSRDTEEHFMDLYMWNVTSSGSTTLRSYSKLLLSLPRSGYKSFSVAASNLWNSRPFNIRTLQHRESVKSQILFLLY